MSANQGHIVQVNAHDVHPESQVEGGNLFALNASESDFVLLQTDVSICNTHLHQLDELGVQVNHGVGERTYLCRYEPHNLAAVRELPWVVYANVYHPDLVIHADLKQELERQPQTATEILHDVEIMIHLGSMLSVDEVMDDIVKNVGVPKENLQRHGQSHIHAQLSRADITLVASVDQVRTIYRSYQPRLENDTARMYIGETGLIEKGGTASAKNQVITVADSGLDIGQAGYGSTKDPTKSMHKAFGTRITGLLSVARYYADTTNTKNVTGATDDPHGHGTHVAATAMGKFTETYTPKPPPVLIGFTKAVGPPKPVVVEPPKTIVLDGIAPDASLYFQSLAKWQKDKAGKDYFGLLPGTKMEYLIETAYKTGKSRIHCNSWSSGAPVTSGYDVFATSVDEFVCKYRDLVVLRAAGNDGDDAAAAEYKTTITSYSMARNGITVGAMFNNRPIMYSGLPLYAKGGKAATEPYSVPMFSARGDLTKGSIKPDLIAPGVAILSAQSQMTEALKKSEDETPVVESRAPTQFCKYDTGTSMAAPVVAGAVACVRQALVDIFGEKSGSYPTAALIKAILINTALDLKILDGKLVAGSKVTKATVNGVSGNAERSLKAVPNGEQGWGCVNLNLALQNIKSLQIAKSTTSQLFGIYEIREDDKADPKTGPFVYPVPDGTGWRGRTITVPTNKTGYALHVHLAYTDFPGDELVNQLHLRVVSTEKLATTKKIVDMKTSADTYEIQHKSNTKGMIIEPIPAGSVNIYVIAEAVKERVIPGSSPKESYPQGFAVVWRLFEI